MEQDELNVRATKAALEALLDTVKLLHNAVRPTEIDDVISIYLVQIRKLIEQIKE